MHPVLKEREHATLSVAVCPKISGRRCLEDGDLDCLYNCTSAMASYRGFAEQLLPAVLPQRLHSAMTRSEHTVAPASSRTVIRHSVPVQKLLPRSLSSSPTVIMAWVRAVVRSGSTIPSSSGRSAPSLMLKK